MIKKIKLNQKQIDIINSIQIQKQQIENNEKQLVQFILAYEDIEYENVENISIDKNELIIKISE